MGGRPLCTLPLPLPSSSVRPGKQHYLPLALLFVVATRGQSGYQDSYICESYGFGTNGERMLKQLPLPGHSKKHKTQEPSLSGKEA